MGRLTEVRGGVVRNTRTIFTHDELRRLFQVIDGDQRNSCLEPATMHILILLLYGAGLRLREAVNLTRGTWTCRALS
jgi:integrase